MAKKLIISRRGLFGTTYHYDERGKYLGKSRPGLFGDNKVHFDENGNKRGTSRPGFFNEEVHKLDSEYSSTRKGLFGFVHRSNGRISGKTSPELFGTAFTEFESSNESCYDELEFYDEITDINSLWWSYDEDAWLNALEGYYALLNEKQLPLEFEIEDIDALEIGALTKFEFYDFLHDKYFVWKYTQKNRLATTRKSLEKYINENRIDELESIHKSLFSADHSNIEECLSIVSQIRGLGTAGASGLLAVLFPEDFGTVDQFMVKALEKIEDLDEHEKIEKMNPDGLKIKDGVVLINIMREKAEELNELFDTDYWTPRKIDMILWSIGR